MVISSFQIRGEFMRASRILSARPERAIIALGQLCEERADDPLGPVNSPPFIPPPHSLPPQTPFPVYFEQLQPRMTKLSASLRTTSIRHVPARPEPRPRIRTGMCDVGYVTCLARPGCLRPFTCTFPAQCSQCGSQRPILEHKTEVLYACKASQPTFKPVTKENLQPFGGQFLSGA